MLTSPLQNNALQADAHYLWGKIEAMREMQSEPITKRDLRRKIHGKQEFDLDSALEMLIERGYIRIENTTTGGRPSEAIIINHAPVSIPNKPSADVSIKMEQVTTGNKPEMLTIRQAAARDVLPERTLRRLVAQNKIPVVRSGKVAYINFTRLVEQLNSGEGEVWQ